MANTSKSEPPIINVHTHTFTKDHTPKFLAKKIVPWPFYKWLETGPGVALIDRYLKRNKNTFTYPDRNKRWKKYLRKKFINQIPLLRTLYLLFLTGVWVIFGYYLLGLIRPLISGTLLFDWYFEYVATPLNRFMPHLRSKWNVIILLLIILFFFGNIRKAIKQYLGQRLKKIAGKETIEFALRYLNIVQFTKKGRQAWNFNQLEQQYPPKSAFCVLPMYMEHMGAGSVPVSYEKQMEEVLRLKKNNPDNCYPFVFVDPRRIIGRNRDKLFLNLNTENPDSIDLEECLLKTYMDGGCNGIKIYPALGYYPFDKSLLPLWLYCAQNDIPITTHCSVGPIFYRGNLKDLGPTYDLHPIFEEVYDKDENENEIKKPLRLSQLKNKDFQRNFTHPLNYLCLVHKPLLVKVIEHFDETGELKTLFGYHDGEIERDLSNLKINLAHYGSAEQMQRFLEKDRYDKSNFILYKPEALELKTKVHSLSEFYEFWHYVDWFSIISSMMKEFQNIYTDVSYTAHEGEYLNLISEIMNDSKIGDRILFGTDFYVVSNHKTEKEFWIDMKNRLDNKKWKKMSLDNPKRFLNL